jgi:hypothetical protein
MKLSEKSHEGKMVFISGRAICTTVSHGYTSCYFDGIGARCRSEVSFNQFVQSSYQPQYQSQWCWAASISMLLSHHGHAVNQARIVSEVYGSPVNMPAMYGGVISQQLNRTWLDDASVQFQSRVVGLYDYDAGIYGLSNAQIVNSLHNGDPLIIGNQTHAMVLTAIDYYQTPFGPNIVAGGVFDPWPGIGARSLQPNELVPIANGGSLRYLAAVSIVEPDVESQIGALPPAIPFCLVIFFALRRKAIRHAGSQPFVGG